MTKPIFTFRLKFDILPGLVTVGRYDGSHSCLTAVTTGSKIIIHSPHKRNKDIAFLNVAESVTAICAGRLKPDEEKDMLVIGTSSSVLAYHVDNNSDLFFKEIPDGVTAVAIGNLGKYSTPLLIVGGNCSIQGFDWKGEDIYWTVTGDNVRSLALVDTNLDNFNELVVGSDDFEIRIFKEDEIISELTETDRVISLVSFKKCKFAYALPNGTVGMYDKLHRVWRVKSKNMVQCMEKYDINGDGNDELITGWSNGKIDARNFKTGEIIFKDTLNDGIAGIVTGDYRRAGRNQLIVVTQTGEVRGYDSTSLKIDSGLQLDIIRDLFTKKQSLMTELNNYTAITSTTPGIPGNTRLIADIAPSMPTKKHNEGHILLSLSTNNLTILRAVTVFAEGIFDGETLVAHPLVKDVSSSLELAICPIKDTTIDIHVRAFIGTDVTNEQFHVFELTKQLPKFSMYLLVPYSASNVISSYVTFQFSERIQRLDMWLSQHFLLPNVIPVQSIDNTSWSIGIVSLRDKSVVGITYSSGTMTLITESISLAAEVVQSLVTFFDIQNLQSFAEFPGVFENLTEILKEISNLQENSTKISAIIADSVALVRSLVVQAEDIRILRHMKDMRTCYGQLHEVNEEMIRNHKVQCNNHQHLISVLRKLNIIIQHASRLRVGKSNIDFISTCRKAAAENNLQILLKLIKTGEN